MSAKRVRIGEPLTLNSIKSLGYITGKLSACRNFGTEKHNPVAYQFFHSKGYTSLKTKPIGKVYISKASTSDKSKITINIDNFILNENPGSNEPFYRNSAKIICNNDDVMSLVNYSGACEFYAPGGKIMQNLNYKINANMSKGRLTCRAGNLMFSKSLVKPLASYWSLFNAVANLENTDLQKKYFNIFEDSGIIRNDQYLNYRGKDKFDSDENLVDVHCYSRIGPGVLPVEYWVDNQGRLLAVISSSLMGVIEPLVAEKLPDKMQTEINRIRNTQNDKQKH